jgi:CheY-like chemotaxis protein
MILIVDDDPRFLAEAENNLAPHRSILFAGNARHAIDLISVVGQDLSVALVDLDLPGESGFDLISKLHRQFPDLPIIAISGIYKDLPLETARVLGASEILRKPITPEWKDIIQHVCSMRTNSLRH